MKATRRRAAILVAACVLGLGGLAVAAPAVAGMGPFGQPTVAESDPGPGWHGGNGTGPDAHDLYAAFADTYPAVVFDRIAPPDVERAYTHLLTASQHHLTAFQNWSAR